MVLPLAGQLPRSRSDDERTWLRWQWRRARSRNWRVDETYVRVRGKWAYLCRVVDKFGDTIDFHLSATRNSKAAKRFLGKALRGCKEWELPEVVNTDKAPTYAAAVAELKAEGRCPQETRHRQVKYLNNVVEADHGKLKQLIRPVRGFKTLRPAYATIKGFEVMRTWRKGQARVFALQDGIVGEARIVEHVLLAGLPRPLVTFTTEPFFVLPLTDSQIADDILNAPVVPTTSNSKSR